MNKFSRFCITRIIYLGSVSIPISGKSISGVITAEDGTPLAMVSVKVKAGSRQHLMKRVSIRFR